MSDKLNIGRAIDKGRAAMLFAGLFLAGLAAPPVHGTADRYHDVIGKWKLAAVLDSAEIASLDERGAERLVGRVFTISKTKVQFGTHVCLPPELSARRVETRLFMRQEAHASAENLGLPNPVTVVELGCTQAFVKGKNRIVIFWDGWFFDAMRVR